MSDKESALNLFACQRTDTGSFVIYHVGAPQQSKGAQFSTMLYCALQPADIVATVRINYNGASYALYRPTDYQDKRPPLAHGEVGQKSSNEVIESVIRAFQQAIAKDEESGNDHV